MPTSALPRRWLVASLLGLLALLALSAWQWRAGPPIRADLLELLPNQTGDELRSLAEARMSEPLNRDLLLLVGHPDAAQALQLTDQLGQQLQASGLFAAVQWRLDSDLPALRQQLAEGRLALLGEADRRQLIEQPEAFIAERLQTLFDPFSGASLVPVEQDWLGLAQRIQTHPPQRSRVLMSPGGALHLEHAGQTWGLLRARTAQDAFDQQLPPRVAAEVERARAQIAAQGGELLATSGLLYAAHGQQQARQESSLIGGIALTAGVLLLLWLLRTPKVLLAVLPVGVGVLAGSAACVALFGQIHVITLVLGASLIGVSLDFPLHFLSKSWAVQPWQPAQALRLALPGLRLALATNLIGYLALLFTPFPALTQIAVFSAAGLLGAFLCTCGLLPWLVVGRLQPWAGALRLADAWLAGRRALLQRIATPWLLLALLALSAAGALQLDFRDDLRQWIARAPQLEAQAVRSAEILGYRPTSQFFLVRAENAEQLLAREQQLRNALEPLREAGQLGGYQALSQYLASPEQQQQLLQALPALREAARPLLALGVTAEQLDAELTALQALPEQDIDTALAGPLGEPWRALWLGEHAGGVASIVSLQGPLDGEALAALEMPGIELVDRPAQLNELFGETRLQASLLKLASCALILLLLWAAFGLRGGLRCLAIPLLAAFAALGCLGWLGQPLTLFALFGLLLVTAVGVDYAILIRERAGGVTVSLLGTALAAMTTWLSFGLLALSQTPAVASFGLAVSLGLLFCFLLAPWAGEREA